MGRPNTTTRARAQAILLARERKTLALRTALDALLDDQPPHVQAAVHTHCLARLAVLYPQAALPLIVALGVACEAQMADCSSGLHQPPGSNPAPDQAFGQSRSLPHPEDRKQ